MKLCHIGWAWSIHVRRWVQWFARRGHECYLITDHAEPVSGVTVIEIPPPTPDLRPRWQRLRDFSIHDWRAHRLKTILWVRRKVQEIAPDVLHSHTLLYPGYLGIYTTGVPYVVTPFNGDVLWKKTPGWWHEKRTKWALRKAQLVTGDTTLLMQACQRLGAHPAQTHVILGGGVDLARFTLCENKEEVRRRLGIESRYVVLSPRGVGSLYNLESIVKSVPDVLESVSDVLFVFIWPTSSDKDLERLRKCISDLGIEGAVSLRGSIHYDEITSYFQCADLVVSVPFQDNLSRCLLEGMACGAVPIVSDLPTLREWISDGLNGRLVLPNDLEQIAAAIVELLQDEDTRRLFAKRNAVLMRERGDENMCMGRMEELYYSLIEQGKGEV